MRPGPLVAEVVVVVGSINGPYETWRCVITLWLVKFR